MRIIVVLTVLATAFVLGSCFHHNQQAVVTELPSNGPFK